MQFVANGPEVPDELIQAHEAGNVVFFCGAGISVPANLPLFKGLVEQIYQHPLINEGYLITKKGFRKSPPHSAECNAYESEFFDRTLYHLEKRLGSGKNSVRHALQKILLDTKDNPDFSLHEALLNLSRDRNENIRLVTTNYDHCFHMNTDRFVPHDAAPKLSVPKIHKWNSLVYLHGKIDTDSDPNGWNLVVTSSDFGVAYLTERWASRFCAELFRNFVIVFIGYSLSDPIMRYLTDSIAAEEHDCPSDYWKPRYAFTPDENNENEEKSRWESYGIEPILYSSNTGHGLLHSTIKEWADSFKQGITGKEYILKSMVIDSPKTPYENNLKVNRVISILRELDTPIGEEPTGCYAKMFLESRPIPPIGWLLVLEKYDLLSRSSSGGVNALPVSNGYDGIAQYPDKISYYLWQWMAKHLKERQLIDYVIAHGGNLHPVLKYLIKREINKSDIPPAYIEFWKLVLWRKIENINNRHDIGLYLLGKLSADTIGLIPVILRTLSPGIRLNKPYANWEDNSEENDKPTELSSLVRAEVIIQGRLEIQDALKKSESYPDEFIQFLPQITLYLKDALDIRCVVRGCSPDKDWSNLEIPSIADHPQNRHSRSWTYLVFLNRDLWEAADKSDIRLADAILELWKSFEFPVFRRLALYALSQSNRYSIDDKLDYLLEDNGRWLTSYIVRREVFEFLRANMDYMKDNHIRLLTDLVMDQLQKDGQSDDNHDSERRVWLYLKKFEEMGCKLPDNAASKLEGLGKIYPEWKTAPDQKDEFSVFMYPMEKGYPSDVTPEKLFHYSVHERISILSQVSSRYYEGRAEDFKLMTQVHPRAGFNTLVALSNSEVWVDEPWSGGITGLKDNTYGWRTITNILLHKAPDELLDELLYQLAHDWLNEMCQNVKPDSSDERLLLQLLDRLLKIQLEIIPRTKPGLLVTEIGSLVEVLINRLGIRQLKPGDGIPEIIKSRLESLLISDDEVYQYACGTIFSRLYYFYVVEVNWAKEKLIPLLNCESPKFINAWTGFLMNPTVNLSLIKDIAPDLIIAVKNVDDFDEGIRSSVYKFFTKVCLDASDSIAEITCRNLLRSMDISGRRKVSNYLSLRMMNVEEGKRALHWRMRIGPFLGYWPRDENIQDEEVSRNLVDAALLSEEECSMAVNIIIVLIGKISNPTMILHRLENSNTLDECPDSVLKLLSHIISSVSDRHRALQLRKILNKVKASSEARAKTSDYRALDTIVRRRGV